MPFLLLLLLVLGSLLALLIAITVFLRFAVVTGAVASAAWLVLRICWQILRILIAQNKIGAAKIAELQQVIIQAANFQIRGHWLIILVKALQTELFIAPIPHNIIKLEHELGKTLTKGRLVKGPLMV